MRHLKEANFAAGALKKGGFNAKDLVDGGYTIKELGKKLFVSRAQSSGCTCVGDAHGWLPVSCTQAGWL